MKNTLVTALDYGEQELSKSNKYSEHASNCVNSEIKNEALLLLSYVTALSKAQIFTWPQKEITNGQYAMYKILIERRLKGEPIAYITGQKEFYSLLLRVSPDTLIPRPETELIVDKTLENCRGYKQSAIKVLDMGTGSGAIALALAKSRPSWQITALEQSLSALEIAKANAVANKLTNVTFVQSNWFTSLNREIEYDCIVANPPYIANNDQHLEKGDLKFEPLSALAADNEGLADIFHIIDNAYQYLKSKGLLIIEHGYNQRPNIQDYLNGNSHYSEQEYLDDYSGLPRVIMLKK